MRKGITYFEGFKKFAGEFIHLFFCFMFTFTFIICSSQNRKIDSLRDLLKRHVEDTTSVRFLINISSEYIQLGKNDSGLIYAKKAFKISYRLNYGKGKYVYFINKAKVEVNQGSLNEVLHDYMSALRIAEYLKEPSLTYVVHGYLGDTYRDLGNYNQAFEQYNKALKIAMKLRRRDLTSDINIKLGIVFFYQKQFNEALSRFNLARLFYSSKNDQKQLARCYTSIGATYLDMGKYNEAEKILLKALAIRKKLGEKHNSPITIILFNLGEVYTNKKEYKKALEYFESAYQEVKSINARGGMAYASLNFSKVYLKVNQIKDAQKSIESAIALSKSIGNKDYLKQCYEVGQTLDSLTGNFKSSYLKYQLFTAYRDSLLSEENIQKAMQVKMQNDFDLKSAISSIEHTKDMERQSIQAEEKSRKQRMLLISVVMGLILVGGFTIFAFNSLKQTRKQKSLIEKQKKEVEEQKLEIEEKNRNVNDSIHYARKIQQSMLAGENQLNEYFTEHFVLFKPKDIVSGDFYWVSPSYEGKFGLVTADSTGHGVPGAIMSMLNIACLSESITGSNINRPDLILNKARELITKHLSGDTNDSGRQDGMDCSLVVFNLQEGLLYVSGANNVVWILRGEEILQIEVDRMPVGKHIRDVEAFSLKEVQLKKGDILYTFTDGFADQFGGNHDKKYTAKRLKNFLKGIAALKMEEQKKRLEEELNNWIKNREQTDDITLMGFRV